MSPAKPGQVAQMFAELADSRRAPSYRWSADAFGAWAEFTVRTEHGSATQRMRWIEPGTFLMGSPDDEPERWDNEGPQHPVTLTRGFWLADTACTQALWRAVMGNNPSLFNGDDQCPVERVSWEDVQKFLRKLESLLPGIEAGLPTEAQWEYACRAGTTTPFSFGEQITPAQVNYDGNYPYAGGRKGEYRARTVPVKSLPANAWGMYEMHGNVWEWCADGLRTYDDAPQQDPKGPADTAHLALRGGSLFTHARGARSADRYRNAPGTVSGHMGFRLCLMSPGLVRTGGPEGRAIEHRAQRLLYVSGPMTGIDGHNFPAFQAATAALRASGFKIACPTEINPDQTDWHACLRRDIAALTLCDGIVLLPGWEKSAGAMLELQVAHRLNIEVHLLSDLLEQVAT